MSEKQAETLFKKYKKQFIRKLGKKALYDSELDDYGKQLYGSKWGGVFPQDLVPLKKNKYYICNTDTSKGDGVHWCGIVTTAKTCFVFDSFACQPTNLLKHLSKKANKYLQNSVQ